MSPESPEAGTARGPSYSSGPVSLCAVTLQRARAVPLSVIWTLPDDFLLLQDEAEPPLVLLVLRPLLGLLHSFLGFLNTHILRDSPFKVLHV